jgi:alkanesulfonate monooxygenase SsuD/methylene tetrahydromethanopterin reductase-like flavin-dependent oxidoreductase (luciferase family)
MKFALNRLDMVTPMRFAASASRAESLGWDMGLIPVNPLKAPDPYVLLAMASQVTTTIQLGTLLDNPVIRHPSVLAGSIATVEQLAPGRTLLGLGSGDTAVRFNGLAPARLKQMQETTIHVKKLLAGERIEVGALRPAGLAHSAPVPVWIAAQGPKTLHMAGKYADGVFIRVGTHPDNIQLAWRHVCEGAEQAGRDIAEVSLALIFHTAYSENEQTARTMARAIAAGYYEYSPALFENLNHRWNGPDVHELRKQAMPDFHHHRDPVHAGEVVNFLSDRIADDFALHGNWQQIGDQLQSILDLDLPVSVVLPHPILDPTETIDYLESCALNLVRRFK